MHTLSYNICQAFAPLLHYRGNTLIFSPIVIMLFLTIYAVIFPLCIYIYVYVYTPTHIYTDNV
jgi:hypothetical protein